MGYSITIAQVAENDARKAFLWYEEQKENLGSKFEEHFSEAIDSIRINPLKTQIRYGDIRVFFLKKFPFGIHFKVSGKNILIVAVFHTSQNPERWKERG